MYGVYGFATSLLAGIAGVTILALARDRRLPASQQMRPDQVHDLGKLLFAFSVFWAYIWYCQYMLIWYGGLPEEAPYFIRRVEGPWAMLFWLNVVLGFGVPFLVLLSARAKKRRDILFQVALVVLIARWLDIWVLVGPPTDPSARVPLWPLLAVLTAIALAMLWVRRCRSAASAGR